MAGKDLTVLYPSAARTATPAAVTKRCDRFKGCILTIDTTAAGASPSTTPKIEGVTSSGAVYTLLTGAAITGTGQVVMRVYPGLPATANVSANDLVPQTIKVTMTHGNSTSHTYSVDLVLIP